MDNSQPTSMDDISLPFEGFREACRNAQFYYPRPFGIYHGGEVYWDSLTPEERADLIGD